MRCEVTDATSDRRRALAVSRFWSKVAIDPSGCWAWNGGRTAPGLYGVTAWEGRRTTAHRVAFELTHGRQPPPGWVVRHRCDNPQCVRPDHLEEGTVADNSRDAVERGRMPQKLTPDEVRAIRASTGSTRAVGARFGVSRQTVSTIRRGITRRHVTP
jgi:hypothetical protein